MVDLDKVIKGNFSKFDMLVLPTLVLVVFLFLIWVNANAPSQYTAIYIPMTLGTLVFMVFGIISQNSPQLSSLPFRIYGFGELREKIFNVDKFWFCIALGFVIGIFMVSRLFIPASFVSLDVPTLAISDPNQNWFMQTIGVPIIEETTTFATIMPTMANFITQAGFGGILFVLGLLSFFFLSGYNILGSVGLLILAFYVRGSNIRNKYFIVGSAVILDAFMFSILHLQTYTNIGVARGLDFVDLLKDAFIYRLLVDLANIASGSLLPAIIAHITNNSFTIAFQCAANKSGVQVCKQVMGFELFFPLLFFIGLMYVLIFWIPNKIGKLRGDKNGY